MKTTLSLLFLFCLPVFSNAKIRMELGIAAGPCFPAKAATLPGLYGIRETVNNASHAMVRTDIFKMKVNSPLNGYLGAHIGGFQFFATHDDGKTKQTNSVGYGVFAVALGAVYSVPIATGMKLRFRAGGGVGLAISGFFNDVQPGLPLEIHAGIAYRKLLLSVGYMNFVGGRFSGYDYNASASRRGMYAVTNAYNVHGIVAELGIQFYKSKR